METLSDRIAVTLLAFPYPPSGKLGIRAPVCVFCWMRVQLAAVWGWKRSVCVVCQVQRSFMQCWTIFLFCSEMMPCVAEEGSCTSFAISTSSRTNTAIHQNSAFQVGTCLQHGRSFSLACIAVLLKVVNREKIRWSYTLLSRRGNVQSMI